MLTTRKLLTRVIRGKPVMVQGMEGLSLISYNSSWKLLPTSSLLPNHYQYHWKHCCQREVLGNPNLHDLALMPHLLRFCQFNPMAQPLQSTRSSLTHDVICCLWTCACCLFLLPRMPFPYLACMVTSYQLLRLS